MKRIDLAIVGLGIVGAWPRPLCFRASSRGARRPDLLVTTERREPPALRVAHHTMVREREPVDGWAAGNRIWCEFVHGKWRTRQGIPTGL